MSRVTIERIKGIYPHPTKSGFQLAIVRDRQVVVDGYQYMVGELVYYYPHNILLPPELANLLKIRKRLKRAMWNGYMTNCRVVGRKVCGEWSWGFISKCRHHAKIGANVTFECGAKSYA